MATGSCTIIVGGQFGSEGKGKVVTLLAHTGSPHVVRCGGPNSGHTTSVDGREVVVRQIPAGVSNPNATLLISAGSVIDEALLIREAKQLGVARDRLIIDPRAVLLEAADRDAESDSVFRIGSTSSGTGAALARRMRRGVDVRLARDSVTLHEVAQVTTIAPILHNVHEAGGRIFIEGTQGFGLSLLHGPFYPFATARDTTAAGFCSEVGMSPRAITDIVMVIRTFPIRVGGNSGPLSGETTWEEIQRMSGAPRCEKEFTSVTKRLRRVGHFDADMVAAAAQYNRPTSLAVMGLDRLDYKNAGARSTRELTEKATSFIQRVQRYTGVPVGWVGTGFGTFDAINLSDERASDVPFAAANA